MTNVATGAAGWATMYVPGVVPTGGTVERVEGPERLSDPVYETVEVTKRPGWATMIVPGAVPIGKTVEIGMGSVIGENPV